MNIDICFYIGIPVAWAIVDREDFTSFKSFFIAVNTRVPSAEVTHLMSDDGMY